MDNKIAYKQKIQFRYAKESCENSNLSCGGNLDNLKIKPGEHILDLGCGRGGETIDAALITGPKGMAVGLDLTQAMVDTATINAILCQSGHPCIRCSSKTTAGRGYGGFQGKRCTLLRNL